MSKRQIVCWNDRQFKGQRHGSVCMCLCWMGLLFDKGKKSIPFAMRNLKSILIGYSIIYWSPTIMMATKIIRLISLLPGDIFFWFIACLIEDLFEAYARLSNTKPDLDRIYRIVNQDWIQDSIYIWFGWWSYIVSCLLAHGIEVLKNIRLFGIEFVSLIWKLENWIKIQCHEYKIQ